MADKDERKNFLSEWWTDPINARPVFERYAAYLDSQPDVVTEFIARPGISYSLRAKNKNQKDRELFALVDVVDDEPQNRWLSVCFYADMITDPEDVGDFVPEGLLGSDAMCFNFDEDDKHASDYIAERIKEAAASAAK